MIVIPTVVTGVVDDVVSITRRSCVGDRSGLQLRVLQVATESAMGQGGSDVSRDQTFEEEGVCDGPEEQ